MAERGPYRSVYVAMLDSPEFLSLTSDERLVLWTLLHSPLGNMAGIFVLRTSVLQEHAGIRKGSRIAGALKGLQRGFWIGIEGSVVWIRNQLRHDPGVPLRDPKKVKRIVSILQGLPRLAIQRKFCEYYEIEIPDESWPTDLWPGASEWLGSPIEEASKGHRGPPVVVVVKDPVAVDSSLRKKSKRREEFLVFWKEYPRKTAKPKAWEAWEAHKPILDQCLAALTWQRESEDWQKDGGNFVPHPATWINQHRWEDEPRKVTGVFAKPKGQDSIDNVFRRLADAKDGRRNPA